MQCSFERKYFYDVVDDDDDDNDDIMHPFLFIFPLLFDGAPKEKERKRKTGQDRKLFDSAL